MRTAEANGVTPQEWADRLVETAWLPGARDDRRRQRRLHPHDLHAAHRARPAVLAGPARTRATIYEGTYDGPYCVGCEEFKLPGRPRRRRGRVRRPEGVPDPRHARSSSVSETNWFFRLSAYGEALLAHYEANPLRGAAAVGLQRGHLVPARRPHRPLDLALDLRLGHPAARGTPAQVVYVWFDALLNYATAVGSRRRAGHAGLPSSSPPTWPADVHLVGKDILRFHAVIWPAMLMAAGLPLPGKVFAHGWLLVGGEKMSKSKLTGIAPSQIIDHFGSDAFRYYFLRAIQFGSDGSFSWEDMSARYTSELANGLGNLASRAPAMVAKYRDGVLPEADGVRRGRGRAAGAAGRDGRDGRRGDAAPRLRRRHRRGEGVRRRREPLRHRAGAVGAGQGRGERRAALHRALHDLRVAARDRRAAPRRHAEGDGVAVGAARGGGGARPDRRAGRHRRRRAGASCPPARRSPRARSCSRASRSRRREAASP